VRFRTLILIVLVAGVAAMAVRPSFDTDTWWHLRAGQWIVENGRVPTTDPFSSTMRGGPWKYPGWLAQVVLLGFYRVGGLTGLTLFTATFVAMAMMFLWPRLEGPLVLRAAVILLAAATSAVYWSARPQIISFALAAVFLWALASWREPGRRWRVWALPVGMAIWVNVHGGFAIGFLLVALELLAEVLDLLLGLLARRRPLVEAWARRRTGVMTLAAVLGLCFAAAAANPYGPGILSYPLRTASIPVLQERIQEWQPPDFQNPQLAPFLVSLLTLLALLAVSRRPCTASAVIQTVGWTAMALLAVRNVPIFALVAAPIHSRHAGATIEPLVETLRSRPAAPERPRLNFALGLVLTAAVGVWIAVQTSPSRNRDHLASLVPLEAFGYLKAHRPAGTLLNDYNWGGYVLWDLYPTYPSFVDGRTDVFSEAVFDDYLRLWTAGEGWEAAMARYDIGVVLLPPDSPLLDALRRAGWREAFREDAAVVMVRDSNGQRAPWAGVRS